MAQQPQNPWDKYEEVEENPWDKYEAVTDMDLPKPQPTPIVSAATQAEFDDSPTVLDWWGSYRKPMTSIGRRTAETVANAVASPDTQHPLAQFGRGAINFVGAAADEMTAPINAIPTALTMGAGALKSGALTLLGRIASAPAAASGMQRMKEAEGIGDWALGAVETLGGMAGMRGPKGKLPVASPKQYKTAEEIAWQAEPVGISQEFIAMTKRMNELSDKEMAGTLTGDELLEAQALNKEWRAHPEFGKEVPEGAKVLETPEPPETQGTLPIAEEAPVTTTRATLANPKRPQFPDYSPTTEMKARQYLDELGINIPGGMSNKEIIDFAKGRAAMQFPDIQREFDIGTGGYIPGAKTPETVPFGRHPQPISDDIVAQQADLFAREVKPRGPGGKDIFASSRGNAPDPVVSLAKPNPVAEVMDAEYQELFADIGRKVDKNGKPVELPTVKPIGNGEFVSKNYPDYVLDKDGGIIRTISGNPVVETPELKRNLAAEIMNTPRAMNTIMDASFPLRQGITLIHKPGWWRAWKAMWNGFGSDAAFKGVMESIEAKPNYRPNINYQKMNPKTMKMEPTSFADWAGLSISNMSTTRELEHMRSLAERVPGVKNLVNMSNRAYTAFANKLRSDTFDSLVNDFTKAGMDPRKDKELAKAIANFVNSASGRGSAGEAEKYMEGLNMIFFSPRLQLSRAQMLKNTAKGGVTLANDLLRNPRNFEMMRPDLRKEYLKSMAALAGIWGTTATIAHQSGLADVNLDPTNSDFMKIRIGNTRLDPGAGFQQFIVLIARHLKQQTTSSTEKDRYGNPVVSNFADAKSRYDATEGSIQDNFLRNKLAPLPRAYMDLRNRTQNQPFDVADVAARLGSPIIAQDLMEVLMNEGVTPEMATAVPSFFGLGAQTYGDTGDRRMLGPTIGLDLAFPKKGGRNSRPSR